jgi:hypothetical protein
LFSDFDALPSFEESNVEDSRVVVDKLEQEHLASELVLKLRLGSWLFWKRAKKCYHEIQNLIENYY